MRRGMAASIDRPRPILHSTYVVLGHNTIRGAAGGSLLNAELCKKRYRVEKVRDWLETD